MKSIWNKSAVIFATLLALAAMTLYFAVFTTRGSRLVADQLISRYVAHEGIDYKSLEGNLGSGMTFVNLEIRDIKDLPEGTVIKVQRLFFNLTSLNPDGFTVEIENIRINLPGSEPIVLSGAFKEQQLDLNIYSKGVTVNEVISYLPDLKKLIPIKGEVEDIDLFVTGHYLEPVIKGNLIIKRFVYEGFLLTNAPLNLDLQLKGIQDNVNLYGSVYLKKGKLQATKVVVQLEEGKLNFTGPWDQPGINIKGKSKVEQVEIDISLKGTVEKPELTLVSDPPYSRQKLMVMLATGKSWQSIEGSIDGGMDAAALTKDFIDYFFFAGRSNEFAKRFGITYFSVTYDQDRKGIAAKKNISENLEVGYGIEQTRTENLSDDVSQKLEGEYKFNERLSVGVEREIRNIQSDDLLEDPAIENNDKVLLKYKKSF